MDFRPTEPDYSQPAIKKADAPDQAPADYSAHTAMQKHTLEKELKEVEARAAVLHGQATAAQSAAKDAQTALMLGTGSAADAATARNTVEALQAALSDLSAQAQAKRCALAQIAAAEAQSAQNAQIVALAQRRDEYARQVQAAAAEANAALERFAEVAGVAMAGYERDQKAFADKAKELTGADQGDVHYHLRLSETVSRLHALGAGSGQAPDLKALPFGSLLTQALQSAQTKAVYIPAGAAPSFVPKSGLSADAPRYSWQNTSDVPTPSR